MAVRTPSTGRPPQIPMNTALAIPTSFARPDSRLLRAVCRFLAFCSLVSFLLLRVSADVVENFESGGVGAFWPFGPNSVTNTTDAAYGGTRAALVSGRTDTWQGIGTDLKSSTVANTNYTVSAWVKLKSGEAPAGLKFTLQRQPAGGATTYTDIFDFVNVTDAAWVQVSGTFSYPTANNDVLNFYMQSSSPTAAFYIDEISITSAALPSFNFDDTTTQGWFDFGSGVSVVNDTSTAQSGSGSIFVSNRTANWQAAAVDLRGRLQAGKNYAVSAWVKLAPGTPSQTVSVFMQRQPLGGAVQYDSVINPVTVNDSTWTKLSGTYKFLTPSNDVLTFYIPAETASAAYWIDSVTFTESAPPIDTSGMYSDFDDGKPQGWGDFGATTRVVDTAYRSPGNALEVTGRWGSWAGGAVDATGKFSKGAKYTVSAWVKLLPGQSASTMGMTFQATLNGSQSYQNLPSRRLVTDSGWVNISSTFTFDMDYDQLYLYMNSDSGTSSYYLDDFLVMYLPTKPVQTNIPALKDALAPWFPLVGAALSPRETTGLHSDLAKKHFNAITADNAMKWEAIQPTEGVFNFEGADVIADFARANGMKIHGHAFVWHSQNPNWLFKDAQGNDLVPGNSAHRDLMLQRLRTHIQKLMARYNDVIDTWDVVNEVIEDNTPATLRNSLWLQIVGPDYIEQAFKIAAEYAGTTKLAINDYNTDRPAKRDFLRDLVKNLRDKGVRIDVVAHQTHINNYTPSIEDIAASIDAFAAIGVQQQISELDVSVYPDFNGNVIPENAVVLQGYRYRDLFNLFRAKASKLNAITFWGLSDDVTWLKFLLNRDDKPLPFDEELQAKPAYWGIVDPAKLPLIPKTTRSYQALGMVSAASSGEAASLLGTALDGGVKPKFTASFKTLWQTNALWVEVSVTTLSRTGKDVIDLFIDEENDKGALTSDDHVHTFTGLGSSTSNGATGVVTVTPTGYRLNAVIPFKRNLTTGAKIGFDVRIRVPSSTNIRQSWSNTRHDQETTPGAIGTLELGAPRRVATAAKGTPVIDGNKDAIWANTKTFTTNQFVFGGSGATASVQTLWNAGKVYVYAVVTDANLSDGPVNPWEEDSFEVFLDTNNAQTTSYDGDDAQYRVNFMNATSFGGAANLTKIASATKLTATGYVVEAAFAVDSTKTKAGAYLGFDFQVNNTDDGVSRSSVSTFNDTLGTAWRDSSKFGALKLE
jgi:endo-1,4-beta-xylanase